MFKIQFHAFFFSFFAVMDEICLYLTKIALKIFNDEQSAFLMCFKAC